MDDVATFLEAVWGHGPHSLCRQVPGQPFGFTFVDEPARIVGGLASLADADVWIGAHPLRARPTAGRGDSTDVAEVVALCADLDWAHPTRVTDKELPSEAEVRQRLSQLVVPPLIVVHSGHGLQPWWPLDHPVSPAEGAELVGRLNAGLAEVGLENGRPDLASILRLPGTYNLKGGEKVPVLVERHDSGAYTPEYLRKRLPASRATAGVGMGGTKHRRGSVTDGQQALLAYVIDRHGGHSARVAADGSMHVTRPGKEAREGTSASIIVGEQGDALLTVFSTSWADIGPDDGSASRSWRLVGDALVPAYLDPSIPIIGASSPEAQHEIFTPLLFEWLPEPFELPPVVWHAEQLLMQPTHGEIAGAEKSLKSYTGLALDIGLAAGLPILGAFPVAAQQRVLLFVGEGGRQPWLRRLAAICTAYGVAIGDVRPWLRFSTAVASVASPKFLDSLRIELETFGPALVHVDPWYAYASSGADSRQVTEVGATLAALSSLCYQHGASLLINHHYNRGPNDGLRQITGAGHAEWLDSWLLLKHRQTPEPSTGRYQLRLDVGSRQWGGAAYDLDLTVQPITGHVVWKVAEAVERPAEEEGADDPMPDAKLRMARVMRRAKQERTREGWVEHVKMRRSTALVAFDEMLEDGLIVEVGTTQSGTHTVPLYRLQKGS